jgi:transposase
MPPPCTICKHPARDEIDADLIAGVSPRVVARRFGRSHSAVYRHAQSHLPSRLRQVLEVVETSAAEDLRQELKNLQTKAREFLARAEAAGDYGTALKTVRELVRMIELSAKMKGEIKAPQVNVLAIQNVDPQALLRMASIYIERHGGGADAPDKNES